MALLAIVLIAVIAEPKQQVSQTVATQSNQSVQSQNSNKAAPAHISDNDWHVWGDSWAQWIMAIFAAFATAISYLAVVYVRRTLEATNATLELSQSTDEATRKALELAVEDSQLNRARFIADQRPWMKFENIKLTKIFRDEYGLHIKINLLVKNIGHTPAENVFAFAHFLPVDKKKAGDISGLYSEFVGPYLRHRHAGSTVFPDDERLFDITSQAMHGERFVTADDAEFALPFVMGAVVYTSPLSDEVFHTGFAADLIGNGAFAPFSGFRESDEIPIQAIVFREMGFSVATTK